MAQYNRYGDISKFVTDITKLKVVDEFYVYISAPEDYDITVDMEDNPEEFEELKLLIVFWAQHICELDNIAQRFLEVRGQGDIDAYIANVFIEESDKITLVYWGDTINTEFCVEFQYEDGEFVLKSFGRVKDIPRDWEKR